LLEHPLEQISDAQPLPLLLLALPLALPLQSNTRKKCMAWVQKNTHNHQSRDYIYRCTSSTKNGKLVCSVSMKR